MTSRHRTAPDHAQAGLHRHESIATYLIVYGLLMLLLVVTVVAAFVDIGRLAIVVALLIAAVKTALVVLYFMHVRLSSSLTKLFVVAGIFWLGILFALTFSDYLTRTWLPNSEGWTTSPTLPRP
jgi:cytochrome c oxidase subunit IV